MPLVRPLDPDQIRYACPACGHEVISAGRARLSCQCGKLTNPPMRMVDTDHASAILSARAV